MNEHIEKQVVKQELEVADAEQTDPGRKKERTGHTGAAGSAREEVLGQLMLLSEKSYGDFHAKLIPNIKREHILGVRVPALRKLAKKMAKEGWEVWMSEAQHCAKDPEGVGGTELFYEEIMLQAMIIGAAKLDSQKRLSYISAFVPRIDNWAVCDIFCGDLKFADKRENRDLVWNFLLPYLKSSEEYDVRFGTVMLLSHYIDEAHIRQVLELMEEVCHQGYYVKMAVAWTLSMCYVKFPQYTETLLTDNHLDDFTHNKTIQKIRESYRISKEDKARLKLLKR